MPEITLDHCDNCEAEYMFVVTDNFCTAPVIILENGKLRTG